MSAWVGLAALASLAAARPGLVVMNDKQQFEGEIEETGDQVRIMRRGGVSTTVNRADVASIDYAEYPARFEKSIAAIPADDVASRVTLARQAFDRGEYLLARRAVGTALDINPLDRDARRLDAVINRQLTMTANREKAATRPATRNAAARPSVSQPAAGVRRRVAGLGEDQVNAVRQGELRRGDRVRVRFLDNVRKRFADEQGGDFTFQQFDTLSDADQALAILSHGTNDERADVRVQTDPASIQAYSRRINGVVVQGCATSLCHGGEHAGDFRMLGNVPDPATAITNFYLLASYNQRAPAVAGSLFGTGELAMIQRGRAMESLLIQYALPRAIAKYKHPAVRGWDGLARSADDRAIREIVDWINLDLSPIQPDYGFRYEPRRAEPAGGEGGAATTRAVEDTTPASASAPAPASAPAE